MPLSANKQFGRGITIAFAAVVILVAIWTLSNGVWWGSLFNGNQTWLIDLPNQPVWSPPDPPGYAEFRRDFNHLPSEQSKGSTIGVELKWDFMLISFFLYLLAVTVLFAVVTLIGPVGQQSFGIYVIRSLALSLSGAAVACFVVWTLVGGWGPPSPLFFGIVGLVVGIWMATFSWSRRASISK